MDKIKKMLIFHHEPILRQIFFFLSPSDIFLNIYRSDESKEIEEMLPIWLVCKSWFNLIRSEMFCKIYYETTVCGGFEQIIGEGVIHSMNSGDELECVDTSVEFRDIYPDEWFKNLYGSIHHLKTSRDFFLMLEQAFLNISYFGCFLKHLSWNENIFQMLVIIRALCSEWNTCNEYISCAREIYHSVEESQLEELNHILKRCKLQNIFRNPNQYLCYLGRGSYGYEYVMAFKDDGKPFLIQCHELELGVNSLEFVPERWNNEEVHLHSLFPISQFVGCEVDKNDCLVLANIFSYLCPCVLKRYKSANATKFAPEPVKAFVFFMQEMKPILKKKHPKLNEKKINEMIASQWLKLDKREEAKYVERSEEMKRNLEHAKQHLVKLEIGLKTV